MKKLLPLKVQLSKICILFILLINVNTIFSQVVPEIIFKTHVLESGIEGQDGATYRFSNVAPGIDGVVQIIGRSSSEVMLSNIDTTGPGMGYDNALQPVVGIPGTAPANSTWFMKFRINFYQTGTFTRKQILQVKLTGLDIDGDGSTLSEWTEMDNVVKIDTSVINNLTFTNLQSNVTGNDYLVSGIIANSPNIDTTATNVMATYTYINTDQIDFTIGAKTEGATTTSAMRLNCLWFRQFNMALNILPLEWASFSAMLNNNNTSDLKWTTASENNLNEFIIERSFDGINYSTVGSVNANGNSAHSNNYTYTDDLSFVKSSMVYYRLRSVDMDGKSQYSETRIIRISKADNAIAIFAFPNPVVNQLQVSITASWQNKQVTYEVLNANGQEFKNIQAGSSSQVQMINMNNLATGLYFVKVSCNGQSAIQKVIKIK